MKLAPLRARVIVTSVEQEQVSAGGVVAPETAKERPQRGRVLAVGQGRCEDGKRIRPDVREGDEVVYSKYGGTEVKLESEEHLILAEPTSWRRSWAGVPLAAPAPRSGRRRPPGRKAPAKPAVRRSAGRAAK